MNKNGITLREMLREDMNKFSDTLLAIKCLNFIRDNEFFRESELMDFQKLFDTLWERRMFVLANFISENCKEW